MLYQGDHANPRTGTPFLSALLVLALLLAGCASKPARQGGYYANDGPGSNPPANLDQIPDATPKWEPLHRFANRPYTVLGRNYVPATELRRYKERGIASWYGRKFHAQRTAIGETYDMYAMTAAHPTLPLPSYARVTNLSNGKTVIVRINDRGPFLYGRIIDLSYAAAHKLGYANQGSTQVEVEAVLPESGGIFASRPPVSPAPPLAAVAQSATVVAADREAPLRTEGGEFFLQLGAFSNLDNAENFLALMEFQLSGNGNSGGEFVYTPHVRARDNLFRVELGPYGSRSAAQRAVQDLETRFGVVPSARPR